MMAALDLTTRLCNIADALVDNSNVQIADHAIRDLRAEIESGRCQLSETEFMIGYEATCLIECIAELAYARSERDASREDRAKMYINSFRKFLRIDRDIAERRAVAS